MDIRFAKTEDTPAILQLLRQVGQVHHEGRPDIFREGAQKYGASQVMALMNKLRLAQIVVHVADARTCVLHPASTTHRQLTDEQLKASGIGPEFIRFSVGIENAEDIIADLGQALDAIHDL